VKISDYRLPKLSLELIIAKFLDSLNCSNSNGYEYGIVKERALKLPAFLMINLAYCSNSARN
jgi:hypothetical protein